MDAGLVILDGWGLGDHDRRDAVKAADTPNFDRLKAAGAYGTLKADGRAVGLPNGQMGNSEVGHLNIGAGRVVKQSYTRIGDSIADGSFRTNEAINGAFQYADEHDGRVHFMGLLSDGGVHSDIEHLKALIQMAAEYGIEAVTHAFTDGRDTSPTGGASYLADLEGTIADAGTGEVATVVGRYYAMDRDQNWERTKRAYDAIVLGKGDYEVDSAVEAADASYDRGVTDEFIEPTTIKRTPPLGNGDAIVWFNFRADRARQLVRMLADINPEWDFQTNPPEARLVTMTQYDKTFHLPVAFPPEQPTDTLGEIVSAAGRTQLRLAESEKYAHVTYFLNGGREIMFDGEIRKIVKSPDVPTYDFKPEMSAAEVTDTAIAVIGSDDPDLLVCNYANPDMVGHTGDFEAAIAAVEAVDEQLGRLVDAITTAGGAVLITADHGNADDMGTPENPHTAHTYNPVPIIYLNAEGTSGGNQIRAGGALCDLAPTLLTMMGLPQPETMTGKSLLE
ncbi:2,3-bisphosphoglycerate-independent phosphoglycerate mutase [Halalkalirubrum salinum]|uniref:2,3-bisphosphoglycerate-independent phosphoglycerate mutase n=1 Tax=Halalkalirubrum salinum TaxID=2563889 RepID=UPI0010FB94D3|nr:2,3-bisphosphoglycerate-independent phosphoglycerate mutase [Halalkalirubrum salinum]